MVKMENCGSLLKSLLVAVILVAAAESTKEEKLASCCKEASSVEITEPILGFLVQKPNPPCVKAVIFQTKSGLYCCHLNAPWVRRKMTELRTAKAQSTSPSAVTSSPVSLLSIITSTASLQSSATILPSFSSSFSSSFSFSSSSPSSSSSSFFSSSSPSTSRE